MRRPLRSILSTLLLTIIPAAVTACARPEEQAAGEKISANEADEPRETPLDHARRQLERALSRAESAEWIDLALAGDPGVDRLLADAAVTLDPRAESFAVVPHGGGTTVVGRDATGALYGALELVERLEDEGAAALPLPAPITGAPETPIRGANLFLSLPDQGETDWWFLDVSFWEEYLDLLARSRMNFLDLQGMYDLDTTRFPNALLYFAWSATYPGVGAPAPERLRNARMLARIVDMAAARGIRVGLLSNRSDTSLGAVDGEGLTGGERATYEREAAADLAARVPGLWRMGFRIGESRAPAVFYEGTIIAGAMEANPSMAFYTRTWLVPKADILSLSRAAGGALLIEAKYNGEHIGPPYLIAGGLMAQAHGWSRYSYEDYLEEPAPYDFIFQIWGGGTHRIFRHASFDRIRRTVDGARLSRSTGFTLLATHAFMPQRDVHHRDPADRFSPWSFRRDELEYILFGRLGYDPGAPEEMFRRALARRVGTEALWEPVQAASEIVPWIQTAHTCGPDQRFFAPDLEWGGTVGLWARPPEAAREGGDCQRSGYHGPYDLFAIASPYDTARDLMLRRATTRLSPLDVARAVLAAAARARRAGGVAIHPGNAEARDVARECIALADLGEYFGHKLRAATALAMYEGTGRLDYGAEAAAETAGADAAWTRLGVDTAYIAPFREHMRMASLGMPTYHWSMQSVAGDGESLAEAERNAPSPDPVHRGLPPATEWLDAPRAEGPGLSWMRVERPEPGVRGAESPWRVQVWFFRPAPEDAAVRVLWKPFSGFADWAAVPASPLGRTSADRPWSACEEHLCAFEADVAVPADGAYFAVEIEGGPGAGWRYPDALTTTPYFVVPPR